MGQVHGWLTVICDAAILMFEFIGVFILVLAGLVGVYNYIRKKPYTRLELAKGMALGLEFKMGGEILRTVAVTGWEEIGMVAGIILLRAALTFLIHWEITTEEQDFKTIENRKQEDNDENQKGKNDKKD